MLEVLVFVVEGQRFGIPGVDVREVVRAVALTPLPDAPAILEGVFNLRGQVVPVLDLRARFGLPPRPLSPIDRFVVASAGNRTVAFRVDEAVGLLPVETARITRPDAVAGRLHLVAGIATLPDGLLLIHDLRTFLSQAESAEIDRALKKQADRHAGNVE